LSNSFARGFPKREKWRLGAQWIMADKKEKDDMSKLSFEQAIK